MRIVTKSLVTPSQGRAGTDHGVVISSPGSEGKHELAKALLIAPEGTPVTDS